MLVDFKLFYFSKEPKESEKIDPIKLAKKVEGLKKKKAIIKCFIL